jgi:hypothetical protein
MSIRPSSSSSPISFELDRKTVPGIDGNIAFRESILNQCRVPFAGKKMYVRYHNRGQPQRHGRRFWWLMAGKWVCILEETTRRPLALLALVLLTTLHTQAQPTSASGTVFDEKGRPVPGVVILDGSPKSTTALSFRSPGKGFLGITDTNGHWSLTNAPERLVFAAPGIAKTP